MSHTGLHVRSAEDLSGIVNSPVLFDVFKHELRPESKEDLSHWRAEHEQENLSFYIATHLNSSYFPAIVTRLSVVIVRGRKIPKLKRALFHGQLVSFDLCIKIYIHFYCRMYLVSSHMKITHSQTH